MKCTRCNGNGSVPYHIADDLFDEANCPLCGGSGEVKTNEEYIRSCSTDELTNLLCALVDTGILNAWTIMYHCADSDRDAVRIWLQKTYEGNKDDNS